MLQLSTGGGAGGGGAADLLRIKQGVKETSARLLILEHSQVISPSRSIWAKQFGALGRFGAGELTFRLYREPQGVNLRIVGRQGVKEMSARFLIL